MAQEGPPIVEWTDHALAKAQLLSIARADVEEAVPTMRECRHATPALPIGSSSPAASALRTTIRHGTS